MVQSLLTHETIRNARSRAAYCPEEGFFSSRRAGPIGCDRLDGDHDDEALGGHERAFVDRDHLDRDPDHRIPVETGIVEGWVDRPSDLDHRR